MQTDRQIKLSQNFLKSKSLIRNLLINQTSIHEGDTVLDIGAGKGIISNELLQIGCDVRAIEFDRKLYDYLIKKFDNQARLHLHCEDILKHQLPNSDYKVFSNIPFAIEGLIIRKLLDDVNPPIDSYLIVQKELAERLGGLLGYNYFFISHYPFFKFSIEYNFSRDDFSPPSLVDCVLFRIQQRSDSEIDFNKRKNYQEFIKHGYGNGLAVYKNLGKFYRPEILQNAFAYLSISRKTKPSSLSPKQWLNLYTRLS